MEAQKILAALQAGRKTSLGDLSSLYRGHQVKDGILTVIMEVGASSDSTSQQSVEQQAKVALQAILGINKIDTVRVVTTSTALPSDTTTSKQQRSDGNMNKNKSKPPGIGKIILVASGKGGVGKSTVAANLTIALMDLGYKVGLLDADIYGPSAPKLFKLDQRPIVEGNLMLPLKKYGVSVMSMGFLVAPEVAAIWRGPMVSKALHQMLMQTKWQELDYLIIDTPPGTGDVHLSLAENYQIDSALVVTTPQELAVMDADKAIDMFGKLRVPVLGIIENMSYFIEPNNKARLYLFGRDGGVKLAKQHSIPLLAQLPITPELVEASDRGKPITYYNHDAPVTQSFTKLAKSVASMQQ